MTSAAAARHGTSSLISILHRRYLDRWEKVHYLGEEADRGSDDDEESRHKRWSARALHSVPLTYNYTQHNIAGKCTFFDGARRAGDAQPVGCTNPSESVSCLRARNRDLLYFKFWKDIKINTPLKGFDSKINDI